MSLEDVSSWMEVGELKGVRSKDGIVLPCAEMVSFAMDFWSR